MDEKKKLAAEIARDLTVALLQSQNREYAPSKEEIFQFFREAFSVAHDLLSEKAE